MNFSYSHLLDLLEQKPSKEDLSKILFQLGHENDLDGDIFNLELTPNRGDCLSLRGLARDLNHFYKNKNNIKIFEEDIEEFDLNFINHEISRCPNISFLLIGIEDEVSVYKGYLEKYFTDLGNKKLNFFTDVSNYLSYELGQPTHCYDFNTIYDGFELKILDKENRFQTLHGEEIILKKGDLVFLKNNEVINFAGIMGGKKTSCLPSTKKVLVESAHFLPDAVIGKAISYDLKSDASHKFERFVEPQLSELALRRFINIVLDHAKITQLKVAKFNSLKLKKKRIIFDASEINRILGTNYDEKFLKSILNNLYFEIKNKEIIIPSFRNDIESSNDIAEEIARVEGYDKIKSRPLNIQKITKAKSFINDLRLFLIQNGFTEVINFQFSKNESEESISIDNPLDINKKNIRTDLEESLIENLLYNEKRQKETIKLFEISDLYTVNEKNEISFERYLGVIASGRIANNYEAFNKTIDKDFLVNIFSKSNINVENYISKIDRQKLDTKKKLDIFSFQLPIKEIEASFDQSSVESAPLSKGFFKYKKLSDFPSSNRDFSFLVKEKSNIDKISEIILKNDSQIIKDAFLFDYFHNEKEGYFKAGYRFIFQHPDKTLTDEEITNETNSFISEILTIDGVSIPGYKKNDS